MGFDNKITRVYENLIKLINYRDAKLRTEIINEKKLILEMGDKKYIILYATRTGVQGRADNDIMVCLIAEKADIMRLNASYDSIMKNINIHAAQLKAKYQTNQPIELIFISDNTTTQSIQNRFEATINKYPIFTSIDHYFIDDMVICPLEHIMCPKIKHISYAEIDLEYKDNVFYPKILTNDPAAIWMGIKKGMHVQVKQPSVNIGQQIRYLSAVYASNVNKAATIQEP